MRPRLNKDRARRRRCSRDIAAPLRTKRRRARARRGRRTERPPTFKFRSYVMKHGFVSGTTTRRRPRSRIDGRLPRTIEEQPRFTRIARLRRRIRVARAARGCSPERSARDRDRQWKGDRKSPAIAIRRTRCPARAAGPSSSSPCSSRDACSCATSRSRTRDRRRSPSRRQTPHRSRRRSDRD